VVGEQDGLLALLTGLLLGGIALLAAGGAGRAVALGPPAPAVLTLVDADGRLVALPDGQAPLVLHDDLGQGAGSPAWPGTRMGGRYCWSAGCRHGMTTGRTTP
jgi:hypothetical protein